LAEKNQEWAINASALVIVIAKKELSRNQKWKMISSTLAFSIFVIVIFIPVFRAGFDANQGLIKYAANWINNAAFYTLLKDGIELFTTTFKIYYVCADCIARWVTGGIIILVLLLLIRKPAKDNHDLANKILLIIAVSFLISPTQFPWYYTWVLPFLVVYPRLSFIAYAIFLPLYQLKYSFPSLVWVEHVPILIVFAFEFIYPKLGNFLSSKTRISQS